MNVFIFSCLFFRGDVKRIYVSFLDFLNVKHMLKVHSQIYARKFETYLIEI